MPLLATASLILYITLYDDPLNAERGYLSVGLQDPQDKGKWGTALSDGIKYPSCTLSCMIPCLHLDRFPVYCSISCWAGVALSSEDAVSVPSGTVSTLIFVGFNTRSIHGLQDICKILHLQKFRSGSCVMTKHSHLQIRIKHENH